MNSEPLQQAHDSAGFDSGKPSLDNWLKNSAFNAENMRTGRTYVWVRDSVVVAYYSLAAHLIVRDDLPQKLGRGSPTSIPSILLARLALDKELHGCGYGGLLLVDASRRIVHAAETVGARFVVVDALDEAAATFYEHYGFRRLPENSRLYMKISDVAASIAQ